MPRRKHGRDMHGDEATPIDDSLTSMMDNSTTLGDVPLVLRAFGFIFIVFGVLTVPSMAMLVARIVAAILGGYDIGGISTQALVLYGVDIFVNLLLITQFIVFGSRLLRNRRHNAARQVNLMIAFAVAITLLDMMTNGINAYLVYDAVVLLFLVIMSSYMDPSLREERALQRRLHAMEDREAAEEGTLGRDTSGKGYITLNFFNLFWIFMVCCLLGDLFETVYCLVANGELMNRTGVLWGPFSPIYGFGAVLMTMALNRFYKRNPLVIFAASAVIGGVFEYLVSWLLQFAFGIVAWNYEGTFLSIDGRTNAFHMVVWGVLGFLWIRLCLPRMLKLVNMIPWNWRYTVTVLVAVFMFVNGGMTLLSLDCWYQREAGVRSETPVAEFFAEHYGNAFMAEHFQTMDLDPNRATRV